MFRRGASRKADGFSRLVLSAIIARKVFKFTTSSFKSFSLGVSKHLGNFRESSIAHDKTECFETDTPFPDVFVPVHARTAGRFGIVKMNRGQSIAADDAIELAKCFFDACFAANVITRSEDVRRIETNAQPFRFAHVCNNVSEMFKPIAETRTLAGGSFERDFRFHFWNRSEDDINRLCDPR